LIVDFVLGCILFAAFLTVPAVKKILVALQGTSHLKRYTRVARTGFWAWLSLLVFLVFLVFVEKLSPAVHNTTHIALILNGVNQLVNTLQFYAAFQLLRAVEFLMKLGSGRKKIYTFADDVESRSDPASDANASSPSARELFQIDAPYSNIESSGAGSSYDEEQSRG
jgi:hypothetical protein